MKMKKILAVAAQAISILAVLIWLGLVIEFSLNDDPEETAFGKQLILSFGGIVIAIALIVTSIDKEKVL